MQPCNGKEHESEVAPKHYVRGTTLHALQAMLAGEMHAESHRSTEVPLCH